MINRAKQTGATRRGIRHTRCLGVVTGIAVAMWMVARPAPANAHEFWLEAITYRPAIGETVPIVQRAGTEFAGESYPYLSEDTQRFAVIDSGGEHAIMSVEGDDPAAEVTFTRPGLARLVYVGAVNEVAFETFAKFEESLKYEHLDHIVDVHKAANKPVAAIKERYVRCAKALIAVGRAEGRDVPIGLPLELVADTNPYQLKPGEPMAIRLLLDGKPAAGVTVKIFGHDKPSDPLRAVTDQAGRIAVVLPLSGEYMVHAVHMREPRPGEAGDWFSLWASLTFVRP